MGDNTAYRDYITTLAHRFRLYRAAYFADDSLFDSKHEISSGSTVFVGPHKLLNVLVDSDTSPRDLIESVAPRAQLHRWFSSLKSSQALAISVFGNLKYHNKIDLLGDLSDSEGSQLFPISSTTECHLEYTVNHLGERPRGETSVDVFFDGEYRVAVECKLTETEIGSCSRPRLKPETHHNYERDHCDGSYTIQRDRDLRCALACLGVKYWEYIPAFFDWASDTDHSPNCPLRDTYQLVRNVLAACVRDDGLADADSGHAVLLYDERNPEFMGDGKAMRMWNQTRHVLRSPHLLRKCSWQHLTNALRRDTSLDWLTNALADKYGF